MKKVKVIALILVGLSISLLMSISNIYSSKTEDTFHGPYGYKSKSFATVKRSANQIVACCYAMGCICAPIGIIALPFSLVGDTLLLPFTSSDDSRNAKIKKECVDHKRKLTLEAQKRGERWQDDDVWCTKFVSKNN